MTQKYFSIRSNLISVFAFSLVTGFSYLYSNELNLFILSFSIAGISAILMEIYFNNSKKEFNKTFGEWLIKLGIYSIKIYR